MTEIQDQALFPNFRIETDNGLITAGGARTSVIHFQLGSSLTTLNKFRFLKRRIVVPRNKRWLNLKKWQFVTKLYPSKTELIYVICLGP